MPRHRDRSLDGDARACARPRRRRRRRRASPLRRWMRRGWRFPMRRSMPSTRRTSSTWCPNRSRLAASWPASAGPAAASCCSITSTACPKPPIFTNRVAGRIAELFSVNWGLKLDEFLRHSGLEAIAVESVNHPRLSSIVSAEVAADCLAADASRCRPAVAVAANATVASATVLRERHGHAPTCRSCSRRPWRHGGLARHC